MKITIAQRLHPFSHTAGTKFLLPKSTFCVQVFPTRLNFSDLEGKIEPFCLSFAFQGPIQEFTAELDLEHALLRIFGKTLQGYMRYLIYAAEGGIWIEVEKAPKEGVTYSRCNTSLPFATGEKRQLCACPVYKVEGRAQEERLSLGMHKLQDWDLLRRRLDLKEIFPHLLRLAAWMPPLDLTDSADKAEGNYALLAVCRERIAQRQKQTMPQAFENLLLAATEGVLVPRLRDTEYQGIVAEPADPAASISPLPLLLGAARCIRSLFYQESKEEIALLPCLPIPFHCGRMTNIQTRERHSISLEWTKKCLRRVSIQPSAADEIVLKLPKGIKHFRLTQGRKMVKTMHVDAESKAVLPLDKDKTLYLDRFEY